METTVEALADEALAIMDQAKTGQAAPPADADQQADGVAEAEMEGAAEAAEPDAVGDMALKAIVESLLFVSAEPLSIERLVSVLGHVSRADVREALALLEHDYATRGGALQVVQVAGGYRIATHAQFASWIRRLEKAKAQAKLSRSAIEALAIIAYRQPVVRGELEKIRGVETSGVIRTLLERKLVRMVGRKDEPGRPIMYGTTKQFLEHFGLRDLSELPPLREFKELGEGDQASLLEESMGIEGGDPETDPLSQDEFHAADHNGHLVDETMVPAGKDE